jgi:hypothetical protein
MEIILGRNPDTGQLKVTIGQQSTIVGPKQSVPQSVSRVHCSLTPETNGQFRLKNLKVQNVTYVNGLAVENKLVNKNDVIELGEERYPLNWELVDEAIPKMYDITHLEAIWDDYNQKVLSLTIKQNRFNAIKAGTGLITTLGLGASAAGLIKGSTNAYFYAVAGILSLCFLIKTYIDGAKVPKEKQRQWEEFQHQYICPNPKCGHFLGNQPYDQIRLLEACPYCRSKFQK